MPDTNNNTSVPDHHLLERFTAIVGKAYALNDPQDIAPYINEPLKLWPGQTSLVLKPATVAEISAIMKLASETGTAIIPQGGNTGLVGGQMPDQSGCQIVLSLSRLNRIREIDVESGTVTVEAGVILQNLQEAADKENLLFPLSLGSQGSAQIGGNLATNAGGTGVLAYGNTRDLCLGIEVVLPSGEVFEDLRKLKKDNTGYDLKNLFIGSEGTLGVITAAVLKLVPKPQGKEIGWVGLHDVRDTLALFRLASRRAGNNLTGFELMIDQSLRFVLKHIAGAVMPLSDHYPWYVLIEISSGRSAEDARDLMEEILTEGFEAGLVGDAVIAANLGQAADFWRLRETMSEAQTPEGASIKHDISVPIATIPDFIDQAWQAVLTVAPNARLSCFGHMGDGNLHYNVSQPVGEEPADFYKIYGQINRVIYDVVRDFNGSISAEHGIGRLKCEELVATTPPTALDLMRRMKKLLDPQSIMNPGKLL
ncbi:FAD-binding oxidoreductase [Pseudochrobactrum asaccharolyticum]|uniref:FAD-binding oxidoreductase n=1 Tax=Pseudochrobactrum asaccharolyticum TaxID=354351 RepID=UPI004041E61D